MCDDIVDDIFKRVRSVLGSNFNGEIRIKLEKEEVRVRQAWGGTEPYIRKKPNIEKRRHEARQHLNRGYTVKQVEKTVSLSRSEIYKLLRKK